VRTLLELGIREWRKQTALELLRDGKVTFAEAAEIAKLSLWEFADLVKQRNIEWVRYTPEEIDSIKNLKKHLCRNLSETLVFNATPLIYLTKVGFSKIFEELKDEKLTSPGVRREVVDEGKRKGIAGA
jgi:predicted HTH domain antitoxin